MTKRKPVLSCEECGESTTDFCGYCYVPLCDMCLPSHEEDCRQQEEEIPDIDYGDENQEPARAP